MLQSYVSVGQHKHNIVNNHILTCLFLAMKLYLLKYCFIEAAGSLQTLVPKTEFVKESPQHLLLILNKVLLRLV